MNAMRRIVMLALSALTLAAISTAASAATPTGFLFKTIKSEGRDYNYTVYVPRNYDGRKKWPLIVFLHGAGECGTDGVKQVAQGIGTAIMLNEDKWPFVVVMPQKPEMRDAWEQHDQAVMEMLARAEKDYNVDKSHVYLTGLSQGGHGTWVIGGKHTDVWAAIAPICGYGDANAIAAPLKTMPIWCFHGEADTTVPMEQSKNIVDAIKAEGNTPKLTTYPGVGHNSWDKAYRDEKLYDWFLTNTLAAK